MYLLKWQLKPGYVHPAAQPYIIIPYSVVPNLIVTGPLHRPTGYLNPHTSFSSWSDYDDFQILVNWAVAYGCTLADSAEWLKQSNGANVGGLTHCSASGSIPFRPTFLFRSQRNLWYADTRAYPKLWILHSYFNKIETTKLVHMDATEIILVCVARDIGPFSRRHWNKKISVPISMANWCLLVS